MGSSLLKCDSESTTILQNIQNPSPNDTAPHIRRLAASATPL
jgi:hypothetical protein